MRDDKRPFFSVVIPGYNSKPYIRGLLESIEKNDCIGEIEIIIVDDLSTEPYKDIVDEFDYLDITYTENDGHKGVPVFGRQKGADLASGEWLTFIDHDDEFEPYVFDELKKTIIEYELDTYIVTNLNIVYSDGTVEQDIQPMNWTHGKFYNMDNFWRKYNLCYDTTLNYSEDIYLSVQAWFICLINDLPTANVDLFTYRFIQRKTSLSHQHTFYKDSMRDYIHSTIGQYLYYATVYPECKDRMEVEIYSSWYHFYFHIQAMIFNYIDPSEALFLLKDYFEYTLETYNIDHKEFIRKTEDEYFHQYQNDRKTVQSQYEFIERQSFYDFINLLLTIDDKKPLADTLFYSRKEGH